MIPGASLVPRRPRQPVADDLVFFLWGTSTIRCTACLVFLTWDTSRCASLADRKTDPFGRQLKEGNNGADESADVALPEEMEQARTRAIQDELRRRGAERSRPQPELDYIDRLLKPF